VSLQSIQLNCVLNISTKHWWQSCEHIWRSKCIQSGIPE